MSWGRSAVGSPQVVITQAEGWAVEVERIDRLAGASVEATEKHQRQIDRATRTITEFAGSLPVGYHMQASANGSVNQTGSPEEWSVTVRAYKPVPTVIARIITE